MTTAPTCPTWCTKPVGHPFEGELAGDLPIRAHSRLAGARLFNSQRLTVAVEAYETPEARDATAITVYDFADGHTSALEDLDPAAARWLAETLLAAAEAIEAAG